MTSTDLVPVSHHFEGRPLTTLVLDGRPCWIARQVGEAIGYALGGRRLVSLIRGEWADESARVRTTTSSPARRCSP